MKVSREAAAETWRRIVDTAGRLFRANGYDGIGVADIMKQAGLTHGGFYGHFGSKDELAAEASFAALEAKSAMWSVGAGEAPAAALERLVDSYLATAHRDNTGEGCALAALGSDAGRAPQPVRAAFTRSVLGRLEKLGAMIPGRTAAARRRRALSTMSGLVGALVLARAVDDTALSDEILQAAKETFRS